MGMELAQDCSHSRTFISGVEAPGSTAKRVRMTNVNLIQIYNFCLKLLSIWWTCNDIQRKVICGNAHCSPSSLLFYSFINVQCGMFNVD